MQAVEGALVVVSFVSEVPDPCALGFVEGSDIAVDLLEMFVGGVGEFVGGDAGVEAALEEVVGIGEDITWRRGKESADVFPRFGHPSTGGSFDDLVGPSGPFSGDLEGDGLE